MTEITSECVYPFENQTEKRMLLAYLETLGCEIFPVSKNGRILGMCTPVRGKDRVYLDENLVGMIYTSVGPFLTDTSCSGRLDSEMLSPVLQGIYALSMYLKKHTF